MSSLKSKARQYFSSSSDAETSLHEPTLDGQHPAPAAPSTKIRLAILATAMVDALGGPAEFRKRFSFPLVTTMIPNANFSLPRGVWTDDTSMTLCLARSLATFTYKATKGVADSEMGGFDDKHQLDMYTAWHREGTLSAIGRCFDIGGTIRSALYIYAQHQSDRIVDDALRHIDAELNAEYCGGNGSLMRVLPIGLAYWRNEGLAKEYARRSSRTTHPNAMCQEACEVWTGAIVRSMRASTSDEGASYSKLDLVKFFAEFPYTVVELRAALALPPGVSAPPSTKEEQEKYYRIHHPVLRLVARTQTETVKRDGFSKTIPTADDLPSSGYVLHTIVAALYCFLATKTFEEGAIMAVNLGDDADTVGAVYAGLAGCWYAGEGDDQTDGVFWSERVKDWRSKLVKQGLVEEIADELAGFSAKMTG